MRRILLIDDNQDFRDVLSARLQREGYTVTAVASGQEGLKTLVGQAFDLVLLDMLMPEQDGIETYQAMRAADATRKVPVILMTGMAVEGHWEPLPYETDGAAFVMGKPYDLSLLVARITQLLTQASGGI
ncbi:MAG: response regulator [Candidatus Omnitrophica bacterium]|nr:response regulator [Candidatus Omnitrophota bacterium]